MDRAVKFRAWDTKRKQFVPAGEIVFSNYGDTNIKVYPNSQDYITDICHDYYEPSRFIVTQFTGLYDCEGKEIYEGDIIEGTFQLRKQDPVEFISLVDFSVLWGATVEGEDVYSLGRCRNIKVLGNLYEHPQLLNNESNT